MTVNRTLQDLLRLAAQLVPGLTGIVREGECEADYKALFTHWSASYPEAGRAYWSSRCWGIVIWQPVYLSVIGVHAAHASLSLTRIIQPIDGGWTREVQLPDHAPMRGDPSVLIEHAAREITAFCRLVREKLTPVIRLNPAMMNGTLADVVLAALLATRKARPEWSDTHVQTLGDQWLAALDIAAHGGYFAFDRTDGSRALALERQTCCYHFRRRDGAMCSTCPRLDKHERIVRLNMERDAALEA